MRIDDGFQSRFVSFLTSSPIIWETGELNRANGFVDRLHTYLKPDVKALFICADPDDNKGNDAFAGVIRNNFEKEGFTFVGMDVLDGRNAERAEELVSSAEFIILAGGHVPTQGEFFKRIELSRKLSDFTGVLMGISAGTMNSAKLVYVQPELEGESVDPDFKRFSIGLGITQKMIIPHYQAIKDDMLDGKRLFEDITYPDSMGREFFALVDGSYVLIHDGKEEICGEAYLIKDGTVTGLV